MAGQNGQEKKGVDKEKSFKSLVKTDSKRKSEAEDILNQRVFVQKSGIMMEGTTVKLSKADPDRYISVRFENFAPSESNFNELRPEIVQHLKKTYNNNKGITTTNNIIRLRDGLEQYRVEKVDFKKEKVTLQKIYSIEDVKILDLMIPENSGFVNRLIKSHENGNFTTLSLKLATKLEHLKRKVDKNVNNQLESTLSPIAKRTKSIEDISKSKTMGDATKGKVSFGPADFSKTNGKDTLTRQAHSKHQINFKPAWEFDLKLEPDLYNPNFNLDDGYRAEIQVNQQKSSSPHNFNSFTHKEFGYQQPPRTTVQNAFQEHDRLIKKEEEDLLVSKNPEIIIILEPTNQLTLYEGNMKSNLRPVGQGKLNINQVKTSQTYFEIIVTLDNEEIRSYLIQNIQYEKSRITIAWKEKANLFVQLKFSDSSDCDVVYTNINNLKAKTEVSQNDSRRNIQADESDGESNLSPNDYDEHPIFNGQKHGNKQSGDHNSMFDDLDVVNKKYDQKALNPKSMIGKSPLNRLLEPQPKSRTNGELPSVIDKVSALQITKSKVINSKNISTLLSTHNKSSRMGQLQDEQLGNEDDLTFCGIQNTSSSCCLNSILQIVYFLNDFREFIVETKVDGHNNSTKVFQLLKALFHQLLNSNRPPNAVNIQRALPILTIDKKFHFQDAASFFINLIDTVSNSTKKIPGASDFLNDMFYSTFLKVAMKESTKEQREVAPFTNSLVEIPIEQGNLTNALNNLFGKVHKLDSNNLINDLNERPYYDLEQIKFLSLPKVLIFQLMRFEHGEKKTLKRSDRFEFPDSLKMDEFLWNKENVDNEYLLFAVLTHSNLGVEHFYTYVNVGLADNNENYFKFDDSSVTKVDRQEAVDNNYNGNPGAYLLIYARKDSLEILRGPYQKNVPLHKTPDNFYLQNSFDVSLDEGNESWDFLINHLRLGRTINFPSFDGSPIIGVIVKFLYGSREIEVFCVDNNIPILRHIKASIVMAHNPWLRQRDFHQDFEQHYKLFGQFFDNSFMQKSAQKSASTKPTNKTNQSQTNKSKSVTPEAPSSSHLHNPTTTSVAPEAAPVQRRSSRNTNSIYKH